MSLLKPSLFVLCLLAATVASRSAYAVEQEIQYDADGDPQDPNDVADDGAGGSQVLIGGRPAGGGSGSTTPPSDPNVKNAGPIQIACLSDDGAVRNADASQVCKAVLPKCKDLKKRLTDSVKDMMSQKIWCYYNGKDCDPTRSTPNNMVGPDTDPICSVVGQKLQGCNGDREITQQAIGKKLSCGLRPRVDAQKSGKKFALKYDGENGKQWISWMRGAYPWLIRKHAAAVLLGIQDDLANVDSLLEGTKSMNQDLAKINQQMREVALKLAPQAKATCNKPDSNLVTDCTSGALSINDPAQRACTIVKAQLLANEGALPNILVSEIMRRVQVEYDKVFAKVITFENPTMGSLVDECKDTGCFGCTNRKKKIAKTASCFFGGEWCFAGEGDVNQRGDGPCKTMETKVDLSSGRAPASFFAPSTCNVGFAAVIESLIRRDICGQKRISDPSDCDKIDIPSKPANAQ